MKWQFHRVLLLLSSRLLKVEATQKCSLAWEKFDISVMFRLQIKVVRMWFVKVVRFGPIRNERGKETAVMNKLEFEYVPCTPARTAMINFHAWNVYLRRPGDRRTHHLTDVIVYALGESNWHCVIVFTAKALCVCFIHCIPHVSFIIDIFSRY